MIISLGHIESGLELEIKSAGNSTYEPEIKTDAEEFGESQYQINEGHFYYFRFSDNQYHFINDRIIEFSPFSKHEGRISPNIYVGTLKIPIYKNEIPLNQSITLEVRSVKTSYRQDYRHMLEEITEKCTELLMQVNAPVYQSYEVDFGKDSRTDYQRFAFVNSIINSNNFHEAIQRILHSPTTTWKNRTESKDIRQIKRVSSRIIRQIVAGTNKTAVPNSHPLRNYGITAVSNKVQDSVKVDSVDTPENRFIKHALEVFLKFCTDFYIKVDKTSRESKEALVLTDIIESYLSHTVLKEVSRPISLKLNNPVLQRKEGYREILNVWLKFDLAAKLIWKGGDDVYDAGKRNIATLYEYWLFFKLLELISEIFKIKSESLEKFIVQTSDGLGLQLKQGKHSAVEGVFDSGHRKLNVRYSFNREFSGNNGYPNEGSWTKNMRPDYTLSIWPFGITEKQAEKEELIVHIHFDAKYKIEKLYEIIEEEDNLDEEKREQSTGKYKNADLLKMHAYRDAIRRTGGAYVLYPGDKPFQKEGFHEVIPGLGAFPVRPSENDSGIDDLKDFIIRVVNHFLNRASQRERLSLKHYQIFNSKEDDVVNEKFPEAYGENRTLLPDETTVIIGYFNDEKVLKWIEEKQLYNVRINSRRGSIPINKEFVGAKYILLRTKDEDISDRLYRITKPFSKIFTRNELVKLGYPAEPKEELAYMVYEIEKVDMEDFGNLKWEFKKLKNYERRGIPFYATIRELMQVKKKD